ncbi:phage holin family protein [Glutamicibacter protophormiae]|uniref:phage holin family protein n=1 Tax=Glutamicibacter protophormiae TaxID=37930 RepID=UPI00195AB144|nr:phage holin family protein [Glutamicibacter protophormiae]QRQ79356.1 phage holin family protein [Glutamicibacter protophormiae]
MIIFLIRAAIYVATAALGLLVGTWLLDDFHLAPQGFLIAVLVFAFAQSLLGPFIFRMTNRYVPAAIGGFGLISTLAALFVASLFPGGLTIDGFTTWILAALIVWAATTLGSWLLPLIFLKKRIAQRDASRGQK